MQKFCKKKNFQTAISFLLALIVWSMFLIAFSCIFLRKLKALPAAVEIDATIIAEKDLTKKSSQKILSKKKSQTESILKEMSLKKREENKGSDENKQKNSINSAAEISQKRPALLYQPLPKIPDNLRREAFKSETIARFYIAGDGLVTMVELIKPSANPQLNHLLLKSLKNWKFSKSNSDRHSIQDIRVSFLVE